MIKALVFGAWLTAFSSFAAMMGVGSGSTTVGGAITLDVSVTDIADLYAFQFDLAFDPAILAATAVTEGTFLNSGGGFLPGTIDNTLGLISFTLDSLIGVIPGVSGSGVVASVKFMAIGAGVSPLTLSNVILLDSNLLDIAADLEEGAVSVSGSAIPEPSTGAMAILAAMAAAGWRARGWTKRVRIQ